MNYRKRSASPRYGYTRKPDPNFYDRFNSPSLPNTSPPVGNELPEKKGSKKYLFFLIIISLIIIIAMVLIYFFIMRTSEIELVESQLIDGETLDLEKGNVVILKYEDNEIYEISLESISSNTRGDSAKIKIQGKIYTLDVGTIKKVDLDKNNKDELELKLEDINDDYIILSIQLIGEQDEEGQDEEGQDEEGQDEEGQDDNENNINGNGDKVCEDISNSLEKSECYKDLAISQKDYTICPSISDGSYEVLCYSAIGIEMQDLTICDKIMEIENPEDWYVNAKDSCYEGVAVAKDDSSICDQINSQTNKDLCHHEIGRENLDTDNCKDISNLDTKDSCYRTIADDTLDHSKCANIVNDLAKNACYKSIAHEKREVSICDNIVMLLDSSKQNCVDFVERAIAVDQGDHSYCPTIDTQMGRDTCYYEIAILINDQGLCEEIDNDSLKETCYRDM